VQLVGFNKNTFILDIMLNWQTKVSVAILVHKVQFRAHKTRKTTGHLKII